MEDLRIVSDKLKKYIEEKDNVKAQYTVSEIETREITMENGEFSLFRTLFDNKVDVKVIKDQKIGSISTNKFDENMLKSAVDEAIASAESGVADEFYDIAPGMKPEVFHKGALEPNIDKLMQRAIELADTIKEEHPKVLVMQIMLKYVKEHTLYRNTNGSEDEIFSGYYLVMVEFAGNDGADSTGISGTYAVMDNLDTPFIELGSVEKDLKDAEDSLKSVTVEGKFEGPVIFTPDAMAQMMMFAFGIFANDGNILSGEAKWLNKVGEQVASDKLTVEMKPWDERIIGAEVHTNDGFRSEDYVLIENGILRSYMDSLYVSNKCGIERAKNDGFDIVVTAGDSSLEEMIKGMERGLIVGAISCGYPGANGEISGVAKNSFYVENGAIKAAVVETMVSFNLADMFQNISAISKQTVCNGTMVMPYIEVERITISGK